MIHAFNTMFIIKRKKFIPTYLYLVGKFLVLCSVASTLRNFLIFLGLDFALDLIPPVQVYCLGRVYCI